MPGPTASSRRGDRRWGRLAPVAAVLLVALLAGLSFASTYIVVQHFRDEALSVSRLFQ